MAISIKILLIWQR